ncbi:MAG: radical SAM protein [Elusimicrobia bacterium]|nr:radical SAM protein [Elusimicrobiota bacterium]
MTARRRRAAPARGRVDRDAFDAPRCFDMVLSYACQARCRFCSQDFGWRSSVAGMPYPRAVETIYLAHKRGFRRIGFTGGEPTLRQDLPKLIALASRIGFNYVRIQTNALRLADYAYAKTLADAGLSFVKFSIHSHEAAIHDALTMVPGSFAACLKAMANLRRLKVGMGVNLVLNRANCASLPDCFEFLLLECRMSDFVIIAPMYEGNMAKHAREMGVRLSAAAPQVRKVYELFTRERFPTPPLLLHFTPCILPGYEQQMLGWSSFNTTVVSPQGLRMNLDETAGRHTVKPETCRVCVFHDRCIGLDKSYADVFGTDELAPLRALPRRPGRDLAPGGVGERTALTNNEICVLTVLRLKDGLTTPEMLALAKRFGICRDCRGQSAVIAAAEALARMGKV